MWWEIRMPIMQRWHSNNVVTSLLHTITYPHFDETIQRIPNMHQLYTMVASEYRTCSNPILRLTLYLHQPHKNYHWVIFRLFYFSKLLQGDTVATAFPQNTSALCLIFSKLTVPLLSRKKMQCYSCVKAVLEMFHYAKPRGSEVTAHLVAIRTACFTSRTLQCRDKEN